MRVSPPQLLWLPTNSSRKPSTTHNKKTDHFAHPDLVNAPTFPLSASHSSYIRSIFSLSLLPSVYLKLSGLLDSAEPALVKAAFAEYSEAIASALSFPDGPARPSAAIAIGGADDSVGETPVSTTPSTNQAILKRRILTFLEPALEAFGDTKLLVGSDCERPVSVTSPQLG